MCTCYGAHLSIDVHCSLKLKKKKLFTGTTCFFFLFILSFTQVFPFTEAQVSSSLWPPPAWPSSTSPPSIIHLPSRCSAQTRSSPLDRHHRSSTSVSMPSQAANSSDQPPINSFSLRPTAICLRPTPPIEVLACLRCAWWFFILSVIGNFVWFGLRKRLKIWVFFFAMDWWWLWLWLWLWLMVEVVVAVVVTVANGRGGCGWCCGFFFWSEIYYFIVMVILFYLYVYIILLC